MFVRVTAHMEKIIHRDYEAPDEDSALKQFLIDVQPLKKQGFIIDNVCSEDFQDWSEDLSSDSKDVLD